MDQERTGVGGRSVQLFLVDGTPSGVVIAEIGNWVGKVLAAPRGRLAELLRRPEASRTGIYVLLGPDPDREGGLLAYIGEADDIAKRIRIHLGTEAKDFADRFAFVVSSDNNLTKAHVRYLESRLIHLVKDAGAVNLTNDKAPDFRRLPEAGSADMDYFLEQVRLLLPLLGFDLFGARTGVRVAATDATAPTFAFATAGAVAHARETEDGFVVLAGSTARRTPSGTFPAGYKSLRERLRAAGQLVDSTSPDHYRFATDVVFSSPSAAASIVSARSASGPIEWKIEGSGQAYRDWRAATLG
jgi:hypothetical protein